MNETLHEITEKSLERFMRYGVKSVSMDDISKSLGMSKKTLYQYYANKEALIQGAIEQQQKRDADVFASIQSKSVNAIDEMVQIAEYFLTILKDLGPSFIYDMRKYYPLQWKLSKDFHNVFLKAEIKSNIERGMEERYYRQNLDPDLVSTFYVASSWAIADDVIVSFKDFDPQALVKQHVMYHLYGLLSSYGHEHLKDYKFFE
ncbi:MAG: AcrR family transcriptional regulator [Saprospiraceae bacterium]|jgi:AcrR family transcriptional regulator